MQIFNDALYVKLKKKVNNITIILIFYKTIEFSISYHIDFLIFAHKNLLLRIKTNKICFHGISIVPFNLIPVLSS